MRSVRSMRVMRPVRSMGSVGTVGTVLGSQRFVDRGCDDEFIQSHPSGIGGASG
jgi:hypothetical protein